MVYRVIFDNMCPNWSYEPEENLEYLKYMEDVLNQRFAEIGYLYLKDALNDMGIACPFNENVGWWYESSNDLPWHCDNRISFGLYNEKIQENRRFINGLIPDCVLDFNVMGNLTDYMLDQAIYIGGPELAQDFFDYPWVHHSGLALGGQYWDE